MNVCNNNVRNIFVLIYCILYVYIYYCIRVYSLKKKNAILRGASCTLWVPTVFSPWLWPMHCIEVYVEKKNQCLHFKTNK